MASYLFWAAVGFFAVMVVYKVVKFASMPLHLRWELYPVPMDPNHDHGGSFMEAVDFVKKPRRHIVWNGVMDMASEIFLLKKVRLHNRHGLWHWSLAMHWGMYLLLFWVILLVAERAGLTALHPVTGITGLIACLLGFTGSEGLLIRRITNKNLAAFTAPIDYFNLSFLAAIFGTGLVGGLAGDAYTDGVRAFVAGNLSFGESGISHLVMAHFALFGLFLVYMPFSRLFHYVAKYFAIDKVLWDDQLNTRGSAIEKRIETQLSYKVNWSAPHIAPGKTWVEEVMITDAREAKK